MTKSNYLKISDRCELCGSPKKLEIHHIIPLCVGGEDVLDNWICVCKSCHSKLTPTGQLSRIGLKTLKVRNNILSIYSEFYERIQNELDNGSSISSIEIMDIFDEVYEKYANEIWAMVKNKRSKEDRLIYTCSTSGEDSTRIANQKHYGGSDHRVPAKKKDAIDVIKKYSKHFNGTLPDADVMEKVHLSRNTYYKYKKELFDSLYGNNNTTN